MRLFIGLPLEEAARASAARLLESLAGSARDVKWASPENLHFTLAFLGEQKPEALPRIANALDRACAGKKDFWISFEGLGAFESWERPRVLWLGAGEGRAELETAAADLKAALSAEGFSLDPRPFRAHLTLGRLKNGAWLEPRTAARMREEGSRALLGFSARRIVLYESRLSSEGPAYAELRVKTLAPSAGTKR